jgi:hypothetical protein
MGQSIEWGCMLTQTLALSDFYIIYNIRTQFASIAPANPPQVSETRFAVEWTYSLAP